MLKYNPYIDIDKRVFITTKPSSTMNRTFLMKYESAIGEEKAVMCKPPIGIRCPFLFEHRILARYFDTATHEVVYCPKGFIYDPPR